jgi:hypothetical protein
MFKQASYLVHFSSLGIDLIQPNLISFIILHVGFQVKLHFQNIICICPFFFVLLYKLKIDIHINTYRSK